MTSPPTSIGPKSLTAIVTFWLFLATACGTTVSETVADSVPVPVESAVAPAESPAPVTAETGGHEYGVSIGEWDVVDTATGEDSESGESAGPEPGRSDYAAIEWADLIPEGMASDEIFARYEARFDDLEVGSTLAESLYQEMLDEMDTGATNTELDGEKVRLAGFVAPLTYDGDIVTEFLLVPNFGQCIHVPPPPPNQTIVVTLDKADGLTVEETWGPVWVEGTLSVSSAVTDLAAASYTLTSALSGVYKGV